MFFFLNDRIFRKDCGEKTANVKEKIINRTNYGTQYKREKETNWMNSEMKFVDKGLNVDTSKCWGINRETERLGKS